MERHYQDPTIEMWEEGGVLYAQYAQKLVLTLEASKIHVVERIKICNGKNLPVLLDGRGVRYVKRDALKYLSSPEATKCISAGAFLVNNKVQEILANSFLYINKPGVPSRMFTDKEKALKWLHKMSARKTLEHYFTGIRQL